MKSKEELTKRLVELRQKCGRIGVDGNVLFDKLIRKTHAKVAAEVDAFAEGLSTAELVEACDLESKELLRREEEQQKAAFEAKRAAEKAAVDAPATGEEMQAVEAKAGGSENELKADGAVAPEEQAVAHPVNESDCV